MVSGPTNLRNLYETLTKAQAQRTQLFLKPHLCSVSCQPRIPPSPITVPGALYTGGHVRRGKVNSWFESLCIDSESSAASAQDKIFLLNEDGLTALLEPQHETLEQGRVEYLIPTEDNIRILLKPSFAKMHYMAVPTNQSSCQTPVPAARAISKSTSKPMKKRPRFAYFTLHEHCISTSAVRIFHLRNAIQDNHG